MLSPGQMDRHRPVHTTAFRLGIAWRDRPDLMRVVPYAALWHSGARSWTWLWQTLPAGLAAQVARACGELAKD